MAQTLPPRKRAAKKAPAKKAAAPKKALAKKAAPAQKTAVFASAPAVVSPVVEVAAPAPVPTPPKPRSGGRVVWVIAVVLVLLAAVLLLKLGKQEGSGPPHQGVYMGNGVPGTLYLPGRDLKGDDVFPRPKPMGERPPVIVIAHGYSADQQTMSTMARSLAKSGYATLTFDFRGHGANLNKFRGNIDDDLTTVVNYLETSPYVDASRIAVLGHSMGAGAALDFGTMDKRVAALIPVSGGDTVNDAYVPPNVLLLRASGDPKVIKDSQDDVYAQLKNKSGVDVSLVTISKSDHVRVITDPRTFRAITSFLDKAFGGAPAGRISTGVNDPRRGTAGLYVLVALGLIALVGRVAGKAVKPLPTTTTGGAWLLLALATVITFPLLATGGFSILPLGVGESVAVATLLSAAVLWVTRYFVRTGAITGRVATWIGDGEWMPFRSVGVPGVLAGLAFFVLLAPAGVVLHSTVPSFERAIYWVILTAAMLPFFAAFEAIVRRGSTWSGIGFGVLGRLLFIGLLVIGLGAHVLPFVLVLVLPLLALQYVALEVFAATAWATGRNAALIAVVDAVFIAWVAVMFTPIG